MGERKQRPVQLRAGGVVSGLLLAAAAGAVGLNVTAAEQQPDPKPLREKVAVAQFSVADPCLGELPC
jgi:hypothetical protein